MTTQTRTWLDNAILQSVAESYLDLVVSGQDLLEDVLSQGVNHPFLNRSGQGATRLTQTQIAWFKANYEIVTHYANDASGFSATLFKNRTTGEYTLSFRSTEYQLSDKGGDWERDGGTTGADKDIKDAGFALAQLSSMESFYSNLQAGRVYDPVTQTWETSTDPNIQALVGQTVPLNVTGYSLGAQMAAAFALLHPEAQHTYTYNAAGMGGIDDAAPTASGIRSLLNLYNQMMAWDGQGTPEWWDQLPNGLGLAEIAVFGQVMAANPGLPTGPSIYTSDKYQAVIGMLSHFTTGALTLGLAQLSGMVSNFLSSTGEAVTGSGLALTHVPDCLSAVHHAVRLTAAPAHSPYTA